MSTELVLDPTPPLMKAIVPKQDLNPEVPVVDDDEAAAAARELGMTFFNPQKSRLLKKIGIFQTQQGVVHLGVGRLAACDEALDRMIEAAVGIATDDGEKTEDRVGALMAGKHLVDSMQRSIEMVAEFQSDKLISGPANTKRRSFSVDQPIVPIQAASVTVNVIDSGQKPTQSNS